MKGENLKIVCRGTHGHTSSNSFPYTIYISYTGTCWNFRDPLSFWKAHAYREWGVVYIQSIHFTSGRAVELA